MSQFFLSCPKGLEEFLELEARGCLGEDVKGVKQEDGGIKITTDEMSFLRLMLSTRIGSRGHRQLGQWPIHELNDLQLIAYEFPFEEHMDVKQTFKVNTLFDPLAKRELKNSIVSSQKFKDGMVDRYRAKTGVRPNVELTYPDMTYLLRIEGTRNAHKLAPFMLTLYCDLTGDPLSNRSYRISEHVAPLRENVAAGLLYKAGVTNEDTFLADPFCGTGTIIAEAVLMRANALPSFLNLPRWRQQYLFARQLWFTQNKQQGDKLDDWVKTEFERSRKNLMNLENDFFFASDLDQNAVAICKRTMGILGVEKKVTYSHADALKMTPPKSTQGVIITNPPYGERLSTPEDAFRMYCDFSEHLKTNFKGNRAFMLVGDPKANTHIHLKTSCKMPVYNGDIDCRLLGYNLF